MASANPGTVDIPGQARSNRLALPVLLLLVVVAGLAGLAIWLTIESERMQKRSAIGATAGLGVAAPEPAGRAQSADRAKPQTRPKSQTRPKPETGPKPETEPGPRKPPAEHAARPPARAPTEETAEPATRQKPAPPVIASRRPADKPRKSGQPPPVPPRFRLARLALGPPLPAAPDPGLVQHTARGPLPVIGADGRKPWQVYARPVDTADKRPRVSIVITALGLSSAATEAAIQGLPGAITLAFAPYSRRLPEWIALARAAGHEVLLNLPLEPVNYPAFDPGPRTLLTSLSEQENKERLLWTLSRGTGYVGVADFMGSKFTMSREHMIPILLALNDRGLLFLDSRSAPRSQARDVARDVGIPFASAARFVDEWASREAIDARLSELERLAREQGAALGMALPYPVSLERIATWSARLEKAGIALVPVSAIARGTGAR